MHSCFSSTISLTLEVQGVPITETMKVVYDQVLNHPRIVGFPYMEVIDNGTAGINDLKSFRAASDTWRSGLDCKEKIAELYAMGTLSQERLGRCLKFRTDLSAVVGSVAKDSKSKKRSNRNKRDGISKALVKSDLPKAVAKQAADAIYAESETLDRSDLRIEGQWIPEFGSDGAPKGSLQGTICLTAPAGREEGSTVTALHSHIDAFIPSIQDAFVT